MPYKIDFHHMLHHFVVFPAYFQKNRKFSVKGTKENAHQINQVFFSMIVLKEFNFLLIMIISELLPYNCSFIYFIHDILIKDMGKGKWFG